MSGACSLSGACPSWRDWPRERSAIIHARVYHHFDNLHFNKHEQHIIFLFPCSKRTFELYVVETIVSPPCEACAFGPAGLRSEQALRLEAEGKDQTARNILDYLNIA